MARHIKATGGEFNGWMAKQVEKLGSPVCQIFTRPFSKPWILVADFREAEDILMRRPEFDKPTFLSDGMLCLGEFAARYKTNDAFKYRRHLKHDLMAPTFLNNHVGPFVHRKGLELVRLLDMKIDLAQGRPFSIRHDYENVALDIVTHYEFGENMTLSAVRPQLELLSKRVHHRFATGPTDRDEPVELPEARLDPFLMAVDQAPAVLEKTTNSWVPKLSHWWWTHQSWYKNIFSHRGYVIPEQIAKAIRNYQRGKVNSALEHVIMREAAMAEKEGRSPQFGAQWLIDEVSPVPNCLPDIVSFITFASRGLTNCAIIQAFGDLIASHHTNSGAMSWTNKYLTDYPKFQAMLRAHLHSELSAAAVEKRQPTYEEITKARLPYLEAVIAEMQLLTPFSMVREATCDTMILGHMVPKGCQVFMVNGGPGYLSPSLHVDEALRSETSRKARSRGSWDETKDLRAFDPQRWLERRSDGTCEFNAVAGPQLGFGAGPRQCWGRRMAQLQVKIIMTLVVWNFEFLPVPTSLGGYEARDGISRQPQKVFVRMRSLAQPELNRA